MLAWLVAVGCSKTVPQSGTISEDIDQTVTGGLDGGSLVVGVVEDGVLTRFAGFGTTDPDGASLPTEDSLYRIGSVSKILTALTVMRLQEEALVDIDAPVTDVLPDFRLATATSRPITARDLMTHRSGIPSDRLVAMFSTEPETLEEVTAALADEEPIHEPGAWWAYSNPGVTVLGHLAQEAAGVPFADAVAARVFVPCGMSTATWDFGAALQSTDRGSPADEGLLSMIPAGAAVASVRDLAGLAVCRRRPKFAFGW